MGPPEELGADCAQHTSSNRPRSTGRLTWDFFWWAVTGAVRFALMLGLRRQRKPPAPFFSLIANICRIIGKDIDLGAPVFVVHVAFAAFSRKYDPVTSRPVVIAAVPLDIQ